MKPKTNRREEWFAFYFATSVSALLNADKAMDYEMDFPDALVSDAERIAEAQVKRHLKRFKDKAASKRNNH